MKSAFVLSTFLISFSAFVQVDEVEIKKSYGEMDYAPQIAGHFDGEIPVDKICDTRGLFTSRALKIVAFDIDYHDGDESRKIHAVGNQIPDSVCLYIRKFRVGNEIYFTNIKAVDLDGSIKHLTPLRLITVRQREE